MSVLIHGMEMPKSCYDCELIDIVKDCPHYEIPSEAYCQIPWIRKRRAEGCPLFTVPPHGRLIDADQMANDETVAYISAQGKLGHDVITYQVNMIVHSKIHKLIEDTPTVIRADWEEE